MTTRRRHPATLAGRLGVLAALTIASACGGGGSTSPTKVALTAVDGSRTTLSAMAGTPTVVNMWATWCTSCVKEMPALDRVASSTPGVRIIGVNVGNTAEAATAYAATLGVRYPQYLDPDGKLSTAFSVSGLPATAFVDASGKVLQVHYGAYTEQGLRDELTRLHLTTTS